MRSDSSDLSSAELEWTLPDNLDGRTRVPQAPGRVEMTGGYLKWGRL